MLTTLPRMFEIAAAATIDVSLCRRTMTVIAAIASAMKHGERDSENVGTGARVAEDDRDAAERHDTRQHGSQSAGFRAAIPRQARRRGTVRLR